MGLTNFPPNLIIGQVDENWVLLGYYAAGSGNSLLTFRENLSVLSSLVKNPRSQELLRKARILTGTISESFGQYLGNISRKHEIKEQQKTAIYILRKVLM